MGPQVAGGVVLSGHTDVVPVTGQAWTTDPFALRVENGRAYGRGAVDMKGFDALALALVPEFQAAKLVRPIHIMLSYDEETTCLGVADTIRRFGADLPMPGAVFVGEPTELQVVDAHKSVVTFFTTVHGHEAHSSKPALGASAVMAAAELVSELNRIADEMFERGDPTGRFDPPYTTVHVGSIEGGTARNILAKVCRFHWEFRGIPTQDPKEIPERFERFTQDVALKRLNRHGPFGRIETEMEVSVPGLAPDPGSEAEHLAMRLAGRNRTVTVPFGTEAGHYQAAGIPTVVCGPGSIDQAHQPDEYITLEQFEAGAAFMRRLAQACSV
jgi:acetylornithine deacetylase